MLTTLLNSHTPPNRVGDSGISAASLSAFRRLCRQILDNFIGKTGLLFNSNKLSDCIHGQVQGWHTKCVIESTTAT
jgi:hypothetical protein